MHIGSSADCGGCSGRQSLEGCRETPCTTWHKVRLLQKFQPLTARPLPKTGLPPMNLEVEVFAAQVCSLVVRKLPIYRFLCMPCLSLHSSSKPNWSALPNVVSVLGMLVVHLAAAKTDGAACRGCLTSMVAHCSSICTWPAELCELASLHPPCLWDTRVGWQDLGVERPLL